MTLALPLVAAVVTVFVAPRLLVLVTEVLFVEFGPLTLLLEFVPVVSMVTVGTLVAISWSKKFWGRRISPLRLPLILTTPTKDLPAFIAELMTLTTLAMAVALPLVASPPVVLAATVASPLVAPTLMLLLMVALV